ncbi:hypothetical protein E4U10_003522 [Claviceps purpurea]|nr:hypothetical protein E4U10_003522 [Claviceps purpurea]UGT01597.1 prenyl transferase [Claviceps purpurea]
MAPPTWFAGRSVIIDLAKLIFAFGLGYLFKRTSTSTSAPPLTQKPTAWLQKNIRHYGYAQDVAAKARHERKNAGSHDEETDNSDKIPDCPYKYIRKLYGRHHFARFVAAFRPTLEDEDPEKYTLILDIMDAVHLCLILVDDVCDNSTKRKNQTAAHLVYGSCETANRAYLVLTRVIHRAVKTRPVLGAELVRALELILEGQDLSLVWRRDGLPAFDAGAEDRVLVYKRMAQLKTGTLFVLLGRLLNDGGDQLDDLLGRFGWYAQLQNDCKNIYSGEYATNKGAVAEDLRNGELSFPIVVALGDKRVNTQMEKAIGSHSEGDLVGALEALQSSTVKNKCVKALQEASQGLDNLLAVWGRHEQMTAQS